MAAAQNNGAKIDELLALKVGDATLGERPGDCHWPVAALRMKAIHESLHHLQMGLGLYSCLYLPGLGCIQSDGLFAQHMLARSHARQG